MNDSSYDKTVLTLYMLSIWYLWLVGVTLIGLQHFFYSYHYWENSIWLLYKPKFIVFHPPTGSNFGHKKLQTKSCVPWSKEFWDYGIPRRYLIWSSDPRGPRDFYRPTGTHGICFIIYSKYPREPTGLIGYVKQQMILSPTKFLKFKQWILNKIVRTLILSQLSNSLFGGVRRRVKTNFLVSIIRPTLFGAEYEFFFGGVSQSKLFRFWKIFGRLWKYR